MRRWSPVENVRSGVKYPPYSEHKLERQIMKKLM